MKKILMLVALLFGGVPQTAQAEFHWDRPGSAPVTDGGIKAHQVTAFFYGPGRKILGDNQMPNRVINAMGDVVRKGNYPLREISLLSDSAWNQADQFDWKDYDGLVVTAYRVKHRPGTRYGRMAWRTKDGILRYKNDVVQGAFTTDNIEIVAREGAQVWVCSIPLICANATITIKRVVVERERVESFIEGPAGPPGPQGPAGPTGLRGDTGPRGYRGETQVQFVNPYSPFPNVPLTTFRMKRNGGALDFAAVAGQYIAPRLIRPSRINVNNKNEQKQGQNQQQQQQQQQVANGGQGGNGGAGGNANVGPITNNNNVNNTNQNNNTNNNNVSGSNTNGNTNDSTSQTGQTGQSGGK